MRTAGTVAIGVRLVVLVLVAGMIAATMAACGNGDDRSAPTTFTVPNDTRAAQPTTPPPSLAVAPSNPQPTRPWRTGFANGVMPLQLDDAALDRDLDEMAATGARWLRVDFYWPTIQDGGPQSWDWSGTDRVVEGAIERGMEILAMPAYSPRWARPPGTSDHHAPLNSDWYAQFLYEAVRRYAPLGVHTWEIWNEPNVVAFWPPEPDPAGYVALLRRAYATVKRVDPLATVLFAGLAPAIDTPTTLSPRTFLQRAYDAGAHGSFDAVALHPESFPALPLEPADWNPFYNAPTLYQVMRDHGDAGKRIWATEFGAPTGGVPITQERQREILQAGYRAWLAWPFTGPMLVYSFRDAGNNPSDREANFGLVQHDGTPKLALAAFEQIVHDLQQSTARR
jgi:hypothetical protein